MAFALVGVAGAASQGAVNTAVTPAYGQTPTAGNLLLLFVSVTGVATLPSSSVGSGFVRQAPIAGTSCSAAIYRLTALGGDAAPTIPAIPSGIISAHLEEWSGFGGVADQAGTNTGTASPVTATLAAANIDVGELVAMCGADFRSVARASNDTWTSNHGTPVLRASNNGVSSVNHYSHATLISNSAAAADTVTMTLSITTSITGLAVAAMSYRVAADSPPLSRRPYIQILAQ